MFGLDRHYRYLSALIRTRDREGLQLAIRRDGGLHVSLESGVRLLFEAVMSGDEGVVGTLLDAGVDPNVYADAKSKTTPLYAAAFKGHREVARALIRKGADVDAADASGVTPLMVAACGDHTGVVDILLRSGANAGAVDRLGRTASDLATRHYAPGTLDLLDQSAAGKQGLPGHAWPGGPGHPRRPSR